MYTEKNCCDWKRSEGKHSPLHAVSVFTVAVRVFDRLGYGARSIGLGLLIPPLRLDVLVAGRIRHGPLVNIGEVLPETYDLLRLAVGDLALGAKHHQGPCQQHNMLEPGDSVGQDSLLKSRQNVGYVRFKALLRELLTCQNSFVWFNSGIFGVKKQTNSLCIYLVFLKKKMCNKI